MRVVVTGGNGVLGRALREIRPRWDYLGRSECDVRRGNQTLGILAELRPDVIVHAAALTDHQHPNVAEVIETNICGTQIVAATAWALEVPLVYISTHYIYEGITGNYDETSQPHPIGTYAWSKFAAEVACVAQLDEADLLIVRGSWYTRETRLDRWAQRGALTDAYCSREPVEAAARKIVALIEAETHGVVNIGGERRSFADILTDEGYESFRRLTRGFAYGVWDLPYEFPADVSVNTAKFDALKLKW